MMQDRFCITKKEISLLTKELFLEAEGILEHFTVNAPLRILCIFSCGKWERRFPVNAICDRRQDKLYFQIQQKISLPDVFLDFSNQTEEVLVAFSYCDTQGKWHTLPETFFLAGSLFWKPKEKFSRFSAGIHRIAYFFFTILLPVWLLEGIFVAKGLKKSKYLDEGVSGKKAVFYHAHGKVKHYTGLGYSLREIKTNYFRRKYNGACRKTAVPKGFLLLSERECEDGGNLDRIRQEFAARKQEWSEFLDNRTIDRLPFREIKRAAGLAASAKVIVLEDFYPQLHALDLRKETKVVQLWHACGAFKMFGLSDIGKVKHLGQDSRNHRNYTYAVVSGKQMIPFYSEAFGIAERQVLPLGIPRTDIFFQKEYAQQIRRRLYQKYPQLEGKKVVLFAPTFRGSGKKNAYYPTERFKAERFAENLPDNTILLIKHHPFVQINTEYTLPYQEKILDLSGKENINNLLFLTSVLITDYSSCIFEAALLRIPMLFYVFDLKEYVEARDFYFDFVSFAPGKKVGGFEELSKETSHLLSDSSMGNDALQHFCDYFLDALDGNATRRVADFLQQLENDENWWNFTE